VTIVCPKCAAVPGERCKSPSGKPAKQHRERSRAISDRTRAAALAPAVERAAAMRADGPAAGQENAGSQTGKDRARASNATQAAHATQAAQPRPGSEASAKGGVAEGNPQANDESGRGAGPPPHASASQLKVLEQCPLRFHRRFVLRELEQRDENGARDEGSVLHLVLEHAARAVLAGAVWPDDGPARRAVLDAGLAAAAPAPAVARAVRKVLRAVAPQLDLRRVTAVEEKIDPEKPISTPSGPVPVLGFVDRLDNEPTLMRVVDYKLGGTVRNRSELETDLQVGLYLVWARERVGPFGRVVATWWFLARGRRVDVDWTPDLDAWVRRRLGELWQERAERLAAGKWPGRPGPDCAGCGFRRTCAPLKRYLEDLDDAGDVHADAPDAALLSLEQLARTRVLHATAAKFHERLRKDADRVLRPIVEADPAVRVVAAGHRFSLSCRDRLDYPERERTIQMLADAANVEPDEVREAVTIASPKLVEGWLDTLVPEARAAAEAAAEACAVRDTRPYMTATPIKGPFKS